MKSVKRRGSSVELEFASRSIVINYKEATLSDVIEHQGFTEIDLEDDFVDIKEFYPAPGNRIVSISEDENGEEVKLVCAVYSTTKHQLRHVAGKKMNLLDSYKSKKWKFLTDDNFQEIFD